MKTYAPDYYKHFKCIADRCKHSCCIGWEIDIDEETYESYMIEKGLFGKKLRDNILKDGEQKGFKLKEDERCPFLNESGLCDIIINLGEDRLCNICADHPRYRNYFQDRCEIGIGMCCEAAAMLLLTRSEMTKLEEIADDGITEETDEMEEFFYFLREKILKILQNRAKPLKIRIGEMFVLAEIEYPDFAWGHVCEIFSQLEYMSEEMPKYLLSIKQGKTAEKPTLGDYETEFEQMLIYFILRHLPNGIYEGNIKERMMFCVLNMYMIEKMAQVASYKKSSFGLCDLAEILRLYSSEIEYSEENTNMLIRLFANGKK